MFYWNIVGNEKSLHCYYCKEEVGLSYLKHTLCFTKLYTIMKHFLKFYIDIIYDL